MENITTQLATLGKVEAWTTENPDGSVRTYFNKVIYQNEAWMVSHDQKRKSYIISCDLKTAIVTQEETEILEAIQLLQKGKRPKKNEMAEEVCRVQAMLGMEATLGYK